MKAAAQFFGSGGNISIEQLGNGLIHHTYKASQEGNEKSIVLQAINSAVFKEPEKIVSNYLEIYNHLQKNQEAIKIPSPIICSNGQYLFTDEKNIKWRATSFINGSYSPMVAENEESAYTVAKSFARFTYALSNMDLGKLSEIISGFHNLSWRYQQFESALLLAPASLLDKASALIAKLKQRKVLVDFYDHIKKNPDYPTRVMHHDCKISNILFDAKTNWVICPVDLDTVMPGKYFSDLGDMIRSMACTADENNVEWDKINIRPSFYKAILKGYLEGIGDIFTEEEKKNIHYAGLMLIYMQSLRFVADYLNGDIYYKITYPTQNLDRAMNQLILLQKLEEFLEKEYAFKA
jgi:Ser/Thr protein kinase RdoA (MazF antagonist)